MARRGDLASSGSALDDAYIGGRVRNDRDEDNRTAPHLSQGLPPAYIPSARNRARFQARCAGDPRARDDARGALGGPSGAATAGRTTAEADLDQGRRKAARSIRL